MSKLRLATGEITKLDLGDGEFLEVHSDLSKRQFNELLAHMPNRAITEETGLTPIEGIAFASGLFEALVKGWSLPEPATVENYESLDSASAAVVDEALINHFGTLTPTDDERLKAETSQGKRRKA